MTIEHGRPVAAAAVLASSRRTSSVAFIDIPQMTSNFVENVQPFHRQGNYTPFAAN